MTIQTQLNFFGKGQARRSVDSTLYKVSNFQLLLSPDTKCRRKEVLFSIAREIQR